jgi:hypothetical protein
MGGQLGVLVSSDILKQAAARFRKQKSRTPVPWEPARKVRMPNPPVGAAKAAALAGWWRELDSNQRTLGGQIYSLVDLTTLPSLHGTRANAV